MKSTPSPLARQGPEVLDWEQVEPHDGLLGRDPLGLTQADRTALGLTPMKPLDLTIPVQVGAEAALAEILAERATVAGRELARRRK